jgi:hypothetical protein
VKPQHIFKCIIEKRMCEENTGLKEITKTVLEKLIDYNYAMEK